MLTFIKDCVLCEIQMTVTLVPQITKKGRETLGAVLKHYRNQKGWSMDALVMEISKKTGFCISKSTLSHLERGNTEPQWNTLSILSSTGHIPFTVQELFAIASEQLTVDLEKL